MNRILLYTNPLNPGARLDYMVEPETKIIDWLQEVYPTGFHNPIRVFVGKEEILIADLDHKLKDSETVTIMVMPAGATVATWIATNWVPVLVSSLVGAAIGYGLNLLFPPETPSTAKSEAPNPVYSIAATTNISRLGEPVGVVYGSIAYAPDYAAQPYVFFAEESNDMFVDEMLCLGVGDFTIDEIFFGETPLSSLELGSVQTWVFGPTDHNQTFGTIEADIWAEVQSGPTPYRFYENVFTSPEVEGWLFSDALTDVVTTPAPISGSAFATDSDDGNLVPGHLANVPNTIDISSGDTLTLSGTTNNDGDHLIQSVVQEGGGLMSLFQPAGLGPGNGFADEQPLNAAAMYTLNTTVSNLVAGPFRCQKEGQEITRIDCDILFANGLYRIDGTSGAIKSLSVDLKFSYQKIDPVTGLPDGAPINTQHTFEAKSRSPHRYTIESGVIPTGAYECTVERLTPIDDDSRKVDETTWAGLKGVVDLDLAQTAYGPVTLLCVRIKATNGLASAARQRIRVKATRVLAAGDSDNPMTALKDIYTNADYGMGRSSAELDLATIDALETQYEVAGGPRFNGAFTARGTGLEAMSAVASLGGAKVIHQFSQVTVAQDEVQPVRTALFTTANTMKNSLEVDYTFDTEGDFDGIEVEFRDPTTFVPRYAVYPVGAVKPDTFDLFGCTDETYALQYATYMWNLRNKRRKVVRFQTELEGLIPTFGNRIGISSAMPNWGVSGAVMEVIDNQNFRVDQELDWSLPSVVLLRDDYGVPHGPFDATAGATDDIVVLTVDPGFTVKQPDDQEPTLYAHGEANDLVRDFIVSRVTPQSETVIQIEGQAYDETIYDGAPPQMGGNP